MNQCGAISAYWSGALTVLTVTDGRIDKHLRLPGGKYIKHSNRDNVGAIRQDTHVLLRAIYRAMLQSIRISNYS